MSHQIRSSFILICLLGTLSPIFLAAATQPRGVNYISRSQTLQRTDAFHSYDYEPIATTSLKSAVHGLYESDTKTSFESMKNVLESIEPYLATMSPNSTGNYPTFSDWGLNIASLQYTQKAFSGKTGLPCLERIDTGDELVYKVTPIFDDETDHNKEPATFSVVDIDASKEPNHRFLNKEDHIEIVSRVLAYKWIFTGDTHGIPFHKVRFGHKSNLDIEVIKESKFEKSAKMQCVQWEDDAASWKTSTEYCHVIESTDDWTECYCYDLREMSRKAIAVGLVGTPKKQLPIALPLKEAPEMSLDPVLTKQTSPERESTSDKTLTQINPKESANLSPSKEEQESEGENSEIQVLEPKFDGKLHRKFDTKETIPLFTKITEYVSKSIKDKAELITGIEQLNDRMYSYLLEEHTDVYGIKATGTAFDHEVSPEGVRFPPVVKSAGGLLMSRKFLSNFQFLKSVEIGVAITDRDATEFTFKLEDHLSLASDIMTITLNAPGDDKFSVDALWGSMTVIIPMTRGQQVQDPRCFRLDQNNVLQESGCIVENFEPSRFLECKCSTHFTRSFMAIDVAPATMQTRISKPGRTQESMAFLSMTENPDLIPKTERQEASKTRGPKTSIDEVKIAAAALVAVLLMGLATGLYRVCVSPADGNQKSETGILCHVILNNIAAFASFFVAIVFPSDVDIGKDICFSVSMGFFAVLGIWIWVLNLKPKLDKSRVSIDFKFMTIVYCTAVSVTLACVIPSILTEWSSLGQICLIYILMIAISTQVFLFGHCFTCCDKKFSDWTPSEGSNSEMNLGLDPPGGSSIEISTAPRKSKDFEEQPSMSVSGSLDPRIESKVSRKSCFQKNAPKMLLMIFMILSISIVIMLASNRGKIYMTVLNSSCVILLSLIGLLHLMCLKATCRRHESPRIRVSGRRNRTESEKPFCRPEKRKHHQSSSKNSESEVECGIECDERTGTEFEASNL